MIASVLPGQGAQKVGMGRALAERFPVCRETFDEADAVLGEPLSRLRFDGPEDAPVLTENAQPAILAVSVATYRVAASRASFAAGHSLGEYSAHAAAGTLSFADALRTVRRRGQYMQEAVPPGHGAMAAVLGLDAATVHGACVEAASDGGVVTPANLNAPGQIGIVGDAAEERLAPDLRALDVRDPACPVVANVAARPRRDTASAVDALIRQVSSPVRWKDAVRRLVADGVRIFVQLGPGIVLAGLIRKIDSSATVVSVDSADGLGKAAAVWQTA